MKQTEPMQKEINQVEEPVIISEFGAQLDDRVFIVRRGFQLKVTVGPPVPVLKGDLLRLTPRTAGEVFASGLVEPIDLSTSFEAVHSLTMVQDGEYQVVEKGDILSFGSEEHETCLKLLRQGTIKERRFL